MVAFSPVDRQLHVCLEKSNNSFHLFASFHNKGTHFSVKYYIVIFNNQHSSGMH